MYGDSFTLFLIQWLRWGQVSTTLPRKRLELDIIIIMKFRQETECFASCLRGKEHWECFFVCDSYCDVEYRLSVKLGGGRLLRPTFAWHMNQTRSSFVSLFYRLFQSETIANYYGNVAQWDLWWTLWFLFYIICVGTRIDLYPFQPVSDDIDDVNGDDICVDLAVMSSC